MGLSLWNWLSGDPGSRPGLTHMIRQQIALYAIQPRPTSQAVMIHTIYQGFSLTYSYLVYWQGLEMQKKKKKVVIGCRPTRWSICGCNTTTMMKLERGILGCNEHAFPLFLMSLLWRVCLWGLSGSLRLRYHGDVMLPISPSTIPPTRITTTSLFPFFSTGFSVSMATHVCLIYACYLFHMLPCLPGSVSLSVWVCLSVCSRAFVCPWLASLCLLFVYLFYVCLSLSVCLSGWISASLFPCICSSSQPPLSVFLSSSLAACLATGLFHL